MRAKRAALMVGAAVAALAVGASTAPVYAADQAPDDGTGFHAGSFWFLQEYEFGGFYDSNVFADPDDPEDGFGAYIQSSLTAKSDWGRHGVQVRLYGDYYHYFEPAN